MRGLTLDQVKAAGRFAWHPHAYLYTLEMGCMSVDEGYDSDGGWEAVRPVALITWPFMAEIATGWHHMTGCDCEFCTETVGGGSVKDAVEEYRNTVAKWLDGEVDEYSLQNAADAAIAQLEGMLDKFATLYLTGDEPSSWELAKSIDVIKDDLANLYAGEHPSQ